MEVVASVSQGRTAAAQCGLFTHKSVPVIFEPPCKMNLGNMCRPSILLYRSEQARLPTFCVSSGLTCQREGSNCNTSRGWKINQETERFKSSASMNCVLSNLN